MVTMLVTRPQPDASETAARLFALDIDALVEPLLSAETLASTLPPADGFAALAATSANALRALHDRGELPRFLKLPLYAVGDRTAQLAQHFGFARVHSAGGNMTDLVALIVAAELEGPVLYPAARQQSGDLAKALAPHGVRVISTPVYAMNPVPRLSAKTLSAIESGTMTAVLFYSRRTAETFARLATSVRDKAKLAMLCLSEAVAKPLLDAHFVRVWVADYPSEEAMMALARSFARDQNPA